MATVTKPIALDESINTTEVTPRNIADVLAQELNGIAQALTPVSVTASDVSYDNTVSGLSATDVQDAIDEVQTNVESLDSSLAEVAKSGSYNDLDDKPNIPTVNDATLTIQKNGQTVQTFTANSATNKTANIPGDTTKITDTEPYVLRQVKGDLVDMEIVGASVAWNQLVQNGNFADTSGWSTWNTSDFSVSGNEASWTANSQYGGVYHSAVLQAGHKYFLSFSVKNANTSGKLRCQVAGTRDVFCDFTGAQQLVSSVVSLTTTNSQAVSFYDISTSNWQKTYLKNVNVIDLTASLGTTIADYIYSLEQANAGDGVAWFRQYFPNAYYAYDPGSIQSVCVSGRKVVGKNLLIGTELGNWNRALQEKTVSTTRARCKELINITPLTQYTVSATALGGKTMQCAVIQYSGGPGTDISDSGWQNLPYSFVSKDTAKIMYVTFKTADTAEHPENYFENAQLELGSTATVYEPYTTTTYPLDSSKELRGLFQLVNGKLKAYGDVYANGGSITRKFALIDLGTLNWDLHPSRPNLHYSMDLTDFSRGTTGEYQFCTHALCSDYVYADNATSFEITLYWWSSINQSRLFIDDSSKSGMSGADFKTAMSGKYLLYELATPTTESANAYQNPQRAYADGTEEFIDALVESGTRDVAIPVGNETKYTKNEVIQPIADYVDNIPIVCKETTPGTYTLTATVDANGNVSYAWA